MTAASKSGPVRLGMVGLGGAAMQMLPSIVADERIVPTAVVEPDDEARQAFVDDFGVTPFPSVEQLAESGQADAVYVATPHGMHVEHAVAALERGVHTLVEKPLALTVSDCLAIDTAAAASGAHVIVGHTHAFDRPVRALRDLIETGELGRVRMISAWNHGNFIYRPRRPEELDTARGGGIVFNQLPHQVDVVRLLGGGLVRSVRSAAYVLDPDRPTVGSHTTFLDFEDGAVASLVYGGYDRFDSDELHDWIDENGGAKRPDHHGRATRRLAALASPDDEQALKSSRGYRRGWSPEGAAAGHPHFGVVIVSCEAADVHLGPQGLIRFDADGRREIDIPLGPAFPDKGCVLDDLHRAAVHDEPSVHDALWGAATVEVCTAVLESSRRREELTLSSQVPVRRPAVPPASTPRLLQRQGTR